MSDVTTPRAAVACRCRFSNVGAHHDRLLRAATDVAKHRLAALSGAAALILILVGIPWGQRPLLPGM